MNITVKYFGLLAEITKCPQETLVFKKRTVADLLEELYHKYPALIGKDFKVAQDLEIVAPETTVTQTQIALLPPFSGG